MAPFIFRIVPVMVLNNRTYSSSSSDCLAVKVPSLLVVRVLRFPLSRNFVQFHLSTRDDRY